MRKRDERREPVFDEVADHRVSLGRYEAEAYAHPHDSGGDDTHARMARLFASPTRVLLVLFCVLTMSAFVTNALFLQKMPRTSALIDFGAIFRGGSFNPLGFLHKADGPTLPDPAPQPPRRADKGDNVPQRSSLSVPQTAPQPAAATSTVLQTQPVQSAPNGQAVQTVQPGQQAQSKPGVATVTDDPIAALLSAAPASASSSPAATPGQKPDKVLLVLQRALNIAGFGPLVQDGLASDAYHAAISRFQKERHLPVTGEMDAATKAALAKAAGLALN
jgi:Putative peptidoglycan binding domain